MDDDTFKSKILNLRTSEWSDVVHWLHQLIAAISTMNRLCHEDLLAKNLALCLTPDYGDALHQIALDVYIQSFKKLREAEQYIGNSVAYLTPGLFAYYQYTAIDIKKKFNEIIKSYYVTLGVEILPILPALISCLIVGLDESNEDTIKNVESLLRITEETFSTRIFYTYFWLSIFRTSKTRAMGFKYLNKIIPSTPQNAKASNIYVTNYEYYSGNHVIPQMKFEVSKLSDNNRAITVEELIFHYYPRKSTLVLLSIVNCLEDDINAQKYALDFMNTHLKIIGSGLLNESEVKDLIITGFTILLKKNSIPTKKFYQWIINDSCNEDENLMNKSISILSNALITYFQLNLSSNERPLAPLEVTKILLHDNDELGDKILKEIAVSLIRYIYRKSQEKENASKINDIGTNIIRDWEKSIYLFWQALGSYLSQSLNEIKQENIGESIYLIRFFKDFSSQIIPLTNSKFFKPIYLKLLDSMKILWKNCPDISTFIEAQTLVLELQKILKNLKAFEDMKKAIDAIPQLSEIYIDMSKRMSEEGSKSNIIIEQAFTLSTKVIIKVQKEDDNIQISVSYSWINYILDLITQGSKNTRLLQIAIEGILKICKKALQNSNQYKLMYSKIKNINMIVFRLWNLIDDQEHITKTIELLVEFDQILPFQFSETIVETLLNNEINEKLAAIHKFTTFWKLSAQKYREKKILSKDTNCIFQMLDFLNNDEPRIRYSSKSWLLQSQEFLGRIIDPIVEILIKSTQGHVAVSEENEMLYINSYDANRVENGFKKLKSILIADKIDFIGFSLKNAISPFIEDKFAKEESKQLYPFINQGDPYINLLLFLSLKFIFGRPLTRNESSLSKEEILFHSSNDAARASAIEFLEQLLSNIEPKEIVPKIIKQIIDPLMCGFHNSLLHQEFMIQSEILNIMKIILLNCNGDFQVYQENCIKIFCHELFIIIINMGIKSAAPFVKSSYINFIQQLIPLFYQVLKDFERNNVCSNILITMYQQLSLCYSSSNLNRDSSQIRAENDILLIIYGIQSLLHYGLLNKGIKEYIEYPSRYFLGLFEIKAETKRIEKDKLAETMLNLFGQLYASSLNIIEKDIDPLFVKDLNISIFGMLPFKRKDYSEVLAKNNEIRQSIRKKSSIIDHEGSSKKKEAKSPESKNEKVIEVLFERNTIYEKALYNLIYPIIQKYPNEVIKSFLDVWIEQISCSKESMSKMIGSIVSLKISILTLLKGLTSYVKSMDRKLKTFPQNKNILLFEYEPSKKEALICMFTYMCIVRTHEDIDPKSTTPDIWKEIIEFLNILYEGKKPTTMCWIFDIVYLLAIKFDPREIFNVDSRLRNNVYEFVKKLCIETSKISSNIISACVDDDYILELPLNPSVYESIYQIELSQEIKTYIKESTFKKQKIIFKNIFPENEQDILIIIDKEEFNYRIQKKFSEQFANLPLIDTKIKGVVCYNFLRCFCFCTMQRILFILCENIYSLKTDRITDTISKSMLQIFPLIENPSIALSIEATYLLKTILNNKDQYREFNDKIHSTFWNDNFFKRSLESLKIWRQIIAWCLQINGPETIKEAIDKLKTSLFNFANQGDKLYRTWKRIAFLIFAGQIDQFSDPIIYENIKKELIRAITKATDRVCIQILTILRVMLLRFSKLRASSRDAAKELQNLWPPIYDKLIQIFLSANENSRDVLLSALKFLEQMSVMNIEDFNFSQWVFFTDSVGWKLVYNEEKKEGENLPEAKLVTTNAQRRIFVPLFSHLLAGKFKAKFLDPEESNIDTMSLLEKSDRRLIFNKNVESMEELSQNMINYLLYLSQRNTTRTILNIDSIEELIEKDFLDMVEDVN